MWFRQGFSIYLFIYLFERAARNELAKSFHYVIFLRARTELKTDRCLHLAACHSSCDALNPAAEGQIYESDLDNEKQSVSKSGQWT